VCTIFNGLPSPLSALKSSVIFIPIVILLWGGSAMANEKSLPLIQFSIKPNLCVLSAGEEVCRDQLAIKWSSAIMRSLCLYQAELQQPLRCWQHATQGEHQFELNANATTTFQLRDTESQQPLSDQTFQVVYNDKKYRRQRRNPWSFF
jgi:hypothetical protein